MIHCSDIEKMARLGEEPRGRAEREDYFAHLESCPSCRWMLESSGGERIAIAEDLVEPDPYVPVVVPAPMAAVRDHGDGANDSHPSDLMSLVSLGPQSVQTQADAGSIPCDNGPETFRSAVPNGVDSYATREPVPLTICDQAVPPRPFSGRSTGLGRAIEPVDPSWPRVPGFDLISKLGEGGMGVVYKARQRGLNRLVALKMIRGDGRVGHSQLDRFRIEAEAVARVRHPNIVQIYEIGEVDGLPYFSLELLEGGGLDAMLAGTPRPGREAAEMVVALCSAIEAAHEVKIIHRDLKPANVVLAADGTPKVTDFGLAKRLEEEDSQSMTGDVMGSPSYMSPEQAGGLVHLVGPATDVYSLGAILYEMLTGRPPFRGTTAWDTVRQVVEDDPVAPSRLQPRVSRDLETIALKCLAKDPNRRYATARAIGDDLRRYLADEPILARPIPFWERGLKWARRRPAAATLSSLAAVAIVAIVGASIWYAQLLADERSRFVFEGFEKLARGRSRFINKDLGAAEVLFAELDRSLEKQPATTLADPSVAELRREVTQELKRVLEDQNSRSRGEEFLEKLGRFRKLRDDALFLGTLDGLRQAGFAHDRQAGAKKAEEALDLFTESAGDGSRAPKPLPKEATDREQTEVVASCYGLLLILAEAQSRCLDVADPRARAERALRVLDSAPKLAPGLPETRAYHMRRIDQFVALGDMIRADAERQRLDQIRPDDALDHFLYGLVVFRQGRIAEAIPEFQAARERAPELFWAKALLANACFRSGRPAEARLVLDECLVDRPEFAWLYVLRGYASGQLGLMGTRRDAPTGQVGGFNDGPPRGEGPRNSSAADFQAAEVDFRMALFKFKSGDSDLQYTLYIDRGLIRFSDSRLDAAAADFEQAIRVDPDRPLAYVNLAGVRFKQEDFDGAIARLDEALARTLEGSDTAGAIRFRAVAREQKSGQFAARADREAALARALRSVDPRLDGIALASSWAASTCRAIEVRERQLAIDDYSAIPHEPANDRQMASDLVGRARLLLKAGRGDEAMRAADEAFAADPGSVAANRLRIDALLARGRYVKAIAACDACLAVQGPEADLLAIRGKAKAKNQDLAGAVRDFDASIVLRPDQPQLLIDRGWVRLLYGLPAGAPQLALDDFERALTMLEVEKSKARSPQLSFDDHKRTLGLDQTLAEAYCGRGNARAARGQDRLAVLDAEQALGFDRRSALNRHRCARIYAIVADNATAWARRDRVATVSPGDCTARAVALLRGVLLEVPSAERASYYRRTILPDDALKTIRRDRRIAEAVFGDPANLQGRP